MLNEKNLLLRRCLLKSGANILRNGHHRKYKKLLVTDDPSDPAHITTIRPPHQNEVNILESFNLDVCRKWSIAYMPLIITCVLFSSNDVGYYFLPRVLAFSTNVIPLLFLVIGVILVALALASYEQASGQLYQGGVGRLYWHIRPYLRGVAIVSFLTGLILIPSLLLDFALSICMFIARQIPDMPGKGLSRILPCQLITDNETCIALEMCSFSNMGCQVNLLKFARYAFEEFLVKSLIHETFHVGLFAMLIGALGFAIYVCLQKSRKLMELIFVVALALQCISVTAVIVLILAHAHFRQAFSTLWTLESLHRDSSWTESAMCFFACVVCLWPSTNIHHYTGSRNDIRSQNTHAPLIFSSVYVAVAVLFNAAILMMIDIVCHEGPPGIPAAWMFGLVPYQQTFAWDHTDWILRRHHAMFAYQFIFASFNTKRLWCSLLYLTHAVCYLSAACLFLDSSAAFMTEVAEGSYCQHATYYKNVWYVSGYIAVISIITCLAKIPGKWGAGTLLPYANILVQVQMGQVHYLLPIVLILTLILFTARGMQMNKSTMVSAITCLLLYVGGGFMLGVFVASRVPLRFSKVTYSQLSITSDTWYLFSAGLLLSLVAFCGPRIWHFVYPRDHWIISTRKSDQVRLLINYICGGSTFLSRLHYSLFSFPMYEVVPWCLGGYLGLITSKVLHLNDESHAKLFVWGSRIVIYRAWTAVNISLIGVNVLFMILGLISIRYFKARQICAIVKFDTKTKRKITKIMQREMESTASFHESKYSAAIAGTMKTLLTNSETLSRTCSQREGMKGENSTRQNNPEPGIIRLSTMGLDAEELDGETDIVVDWTMGSLAGFGGYSARPSLARKPLRLFEDLFTKKTLWERSKYVDSNIPDYIN